MSHSTSRRHAAASVFAVCGLVLSAAPVHGQSITDPCMGWEMSVPVLQELAAAVRARRASDPGLLPGMVGEDRVLSTTP